MQGSTPSNPKPLRLSASTKASTTLTGLSSAALRRERRQMGMIFQEYALVERLTVMENVLSGRLGYVGFWRSFLRRYPEEDVAKAFQLLERVGLTAHADKRADALSGCACDVATSHPIRADRWSR